MRNFTISAIVIGLISLFIGPIFGSMVNAAEPTGYLSVTGPCNLDFPRDHGPHPGYRTEWWYYTGNLQAETGEKYGFQLTFFRSQISPPDERQKWPQPPSACRTQQVYLAPTPISNIPGKQLLQPELESREAPNMPGAKQIEDTKPESTTLELHYP